MNKGICPKCEKPLEQIETEDISVTVNSTAEWKGVSFSCPHCHTVLSAGIDPMALKTALLNEILETLRVPKDDQYSLKRRAEGAPAKSKKRHGLKKDSR